LILDISTNLRRETRATTEELMNPSLDKDMGRNSEGQPGSQ
jgi:hypothetical protein